MTVFAVFALVLGFNGAAYAAAGDEPDHEKFMEVNEDGTYTIALNVTGDAERKPQKVNVIVILDRSGSMNESAGTVSTVTYTPTPTNGNNLYGTLEADPDVHDDGDFFQLTRYNAGNVNVYTYPSQGSTTYAPTNSNNGTQYGLVDGEYVQLTRSGGFFGSYYWTYGQGTRYNGTRYTLVNNAAQYTGQRYTRQEGNQSRLDATKEAVNGLAGTLLGYNGNENPDDTVEMALVSFATSAATNVASTTDATTFTNAVNGITVATGNNAGTNWEAALKEAYGINFNDDDPTFVIFFSDGAPTFYGSGTNPSGSGQEKEPNMTNSYNAATDDARTLANKVGTDNFYTIFAYGETYGATYMSRLTTAAGAPSGNNYSAENTAQLQEAFNEILTKIEMSGIGNVDITDGTTSNVATTSGTAHLLDVDPSSFKYYRAGGENEDGSVKYDPAATTMTTSTGETKNIGVEWTGDDVPPAEFNNSTGNVEWDLGDNFLLENGVTYTVTFDCWPSQDTLDHVASIKNDPSYYNTLDENIQKYLDANGNLKTNTTANMTYTDTRTGKDGEAGFENPAPVPTTAVEQLAISKEWKNRIPGEEQPKSINLNVTRDGVNTYSMELEDPSWEDGVYISIGIMRTHGTEPVELLTTGHDFTFTEPADLGYHWEIEVPTVRPMLIDGQLTMLIKVDEKHPAPEGATVYTLPTSGSVAGGVYYVGSTEEASLTATNYRRSYLDIVKVVDGEDADPDQTFPFTLNVVDIKAEEGSADNLNSDYYIWFSVWNGGYVDRLVSGAEKEINEETGEWTGYYYAPSGTNVELQLKNGDSLRVLNLPEGSTYTITEGTLPDNYAFVSSELTSGTDEDFVGGRITTGTIASTNTDYKVTYNNRYDLSDVEITKVWVDNNNQDGKRPEAEEFKSYLVLYADGIDVTAATADKLTVTDNGDNTYTAKWTGLDRYADGKEITYTVEETEIEGYTTTGSPAEDKGTITNTHTPEVTTVTVTKVWEDSDDIGGIRPESITAQLTADGTASGDPVTLDESNSWTYTWTDLPKYANGNEIVYSADETAVPAGYTKTGPEKTTDDDGTVTFTVTNTYVPTPVSVDPPVQKIITGKDDLYNRGDFTFTIEAVTDGAPMPANISITNSADYELEDKTGFYEFGEITFTMPGTYEYTVTESGTVPGVTNDSEASKTLTFTVEDDGNGNLTVTPTTDQVQLSFTNTYNASGEATITVTKALEGAEWPSSKTLTLTLAGAEGAPMPETTTATLTAEGNVSFGPIAYGLSDAGKSYEYTITEDGFGAGWTGAPTSITATVEVTDKGDGTLGTTVTYSPEDATITNTYAATGSAVIKVDKVLTGRDWLEGEEYTFTLSGPDGVIETKTVSEDNLTAEFSKIAYTEADAGKTYTYTVSETSTLPGGISKSDDVTVTVKVTDNGNGTLDTDVAYSDNNSTITNTYEASGSVELEAFKDLEGREWQTGETYTFTLKDAEGNVLDEQVVDSNEKVTFEAIEYTQDDMVDEEGNYTNEVTLTYTIEETTTLPGGMENSGVIDVTVTLVDNGDGTITATPEYTKNDTITNTYTAEGEAEIKVSKAIEGAAWPKDADGNAKTLTLTLSGEGGTLPEQTTQTLSAAGQATFDPITYTQDDMVDDEGNYTTEKTFTYTISEDGFGTGWTGSGDVTATVKVTDDGKGTLNTEVTYSPENATITNTYKATGTATIEATKSLVGRAWKDGETFTFTLLDGDGKVCGEPKSVSAENPTATFDALSYTEADMVDSEGNYTAEKTFTYTISETSELPGGISKSDDVTVTVKVTDNGNGTLDTDVAYDNDDTIINTYTAKPVKAQITVDKKITGYIEGEDPYGNIVDRTFTVTMKPVDGAPMPEGKSELTTYITTVGGEGSATFDEIEYTFDDMLDDEGNRVTTKDFTYTVKETAGSDDGYTYDENEYEAVVTVTDDQNGKLVVSNIAMVDDNIDTDVTIENEFAEESVDVELTATKTIKDESNSAKDATFTFTLTPVDGAPGEVQEKSVTTEGFVGSVKFDPITFTEAGEYEYTVVETVDEPQDGWTYDTAEYTVTIVVNDNFETAVLEQATELTKDGEAVTEISFTNTYKAAETTSKLLVKKEVEDTSGSAADLTFEFTLAGEGEVPMPETTTKSIKAGQTAEFGPITYEQAGTFGYTITETAIDAAGWISDTTSYPVTVTVKDVDAQLVATVVYNKSEDLTELTVTNIYDPEDATAAPQARKVVDDQSNSAPDETFTFNLLDADGNVVETKTINNGGLVKFSKLTFSEVGDYAYTIQEVEGSTKGFTYDTTEHGLTISVTDPGDGQLVADITYADGDEALITNVYKAEPTTATFDVAKKIDGPVVESSESTFTFTLATSDGSPMPATDTTTVTGEGTASFGEITYEKAGTYNYTVTEVKGDATGYTYDSTTYSVVVKVTDVDGALKAEVVEGTDITFTNTYKPLATGVTVNAAKELTGRELVEGEFTFEMKDENGNVVATATNAADGTVTFTTANDLFTKAGTYTFTANEVEGSAEGVTYDTAAKSFEVVVTDEGGQLVAKPAEGTQIVFTNDYNPNATSAGFQAKKVLEGRDLTAGEFSFELKDSNGTVVKTATNAADGTVDFGQLSFTEPGTYTYTATEVKGDDVHITYDANAITYTVTVSDAGGHLSASVTSTGDATFTNTYKGAEPVWIDPPVQKVIKAPTGTKPAAATFTFQMKAITEGAPMPEGSVDGIKTMEITGAGTKEFGKTTYTEVGTYVYEITEVKGNAEGYTYDTAVYTLTVEVTEGADGNLVAKETYVDANGKVVKSATATFTNTYTPKPPVLPQTSDDSVPTSTLVAVAGTGFALLLAGLSLRLRRNEE